MERKEEKVNKKLRDADAKLEEVENMKKSQFEMLEKISGYTKEQAKSLLACKTRKGAHSRQGR